MATFGKARARVLFPVPLSLTPGEVAQRAQDRLGARARVVHTLAATATRAIFAPISIDHTDAQRAWLLERSLRRAMYPGWRRLHRIGRRLDPRPLWGRRPGDRRRRPIPGRPERHAG